MLKVNLTLDTLFVWNSENYYTYLLERCIVNNFNRLQYPHQGSYDDKRKLVGTLVRTTEVFQADYNYRFYVYRKMIIFFHITRFM